MTSYQATTAVGAVRAAQVVPGGLGIIALPGSPFPLGATPSEQAWASLARTSP